LRSEFPECIESRVRKAEHSRTLERQEAAPRAGEYPLGCLMLLLLLLGKLEVNGKDQMAKKKKGI